MAPMPPFLTSSQVADALGVHRSTVHRWVKGGALEPAWVIPHASSHSYFFETGAVRDFARANRLPLRLRFDAVAVADSGPQT